MVELGKIQCLNVVKKVEFGIYLGTETDKVLLPAKQVPADIEIGDAMTVFVYRDSSDRLIATTKTPKILLGQTAVLKVSQTGKIGAFLDWGLEKDILLPFKEQTTHVQEGDECLVALYIDKSNRLAATMRVYDYLSTGSQYVKDSAVTGTVIEINPDFGIYVAVDNKYFGMILKNEMFGKIKIGDTFHGRVTKVRDDGKLTISLKQKAYIQMDEDSRLIYDAIKANGGSLPFTDKAEPELIKDKFNMSKNAFKRAVGRLLKEGRIKINADSIVSTGK
ncbi:MAG: S1-like domain-containing RNA-binding protein [Eubacteriales bacterium]|nr:S1-like domain-containing RNA-binding protein [Eubacteriales bacterium]